MSVTQPSLSIVMATYNGAPYLAEQIASLKTQSFKGWSLILSDDGSCDATLDIARECLPPARLRCLDGPQQGCAQNFLHGFTQVPDGHHTAFCDQDDVWEPDKLSRALDALKGVSGPAMYTAGRYVNDTPQKRIKSASFARCLLRNRAAGHTCVFNPQATTLLKTLMPCHPIAFHDWWAALVITGTGGTWVHDPTPVLHYRQHGRNVIGARGGRMSLLARGTYLNWVRQNCAALQDHLPGLTSKARRDLARVHYWIGPPAQHLRRLRSGPI